MFWLYQARLGSSGYRDDIRRGSKSFRSYVLPTVARLPADETFGWRHNGV